MASARDKPSSSKRSASAPREGAEGAGKKPKTPRATAKSKVPRSTKRSAVSGRREGREGRVPSPKPRDGGRKLARGVEADAPKPRATDPSGVQGSRPEHYRPENPSSRVSTASGSSEAAPTRARSASRTGSGRDGGDAADPGRVMELHWGDEAPSSRRRGLVDRWVRRGNGLLRHLAEHGAARHEVRADLKDGRFFWLDGEGRVSVSARAQALCSWSRSTAALSMAWADPLVRDVAIPRVEGFAAERDDVDEELAWRVAMQAAEASRADYLYRVDTPHAWYFLALSKLTFHAERPTFSPASPVGLVRRGLADIRTAVESRAEPASVLRLRLSSLGEALLVEADAAYRGSEWVTPLTQTGKRLAALADALPPASFSATPTGRGSEWLDRASTIDLSDAVAVLEDEWVG